MRDLARRADRLIPGEHVSTELREIAARTLAEVPINTGFARAVVDEVVEGELWADRAEDPRAFHAVHPYGMSLVWGPAVDEAFDVVVAYLGERSAAGLGEWLQVEPRWASLDWDGRFGAVPVEDHDEVAAAAQVVRHTRVNFAFDKAAFWAERDAHLPSEPWQVRRATGDDFEWSGSVVPSGFWPDAQAFLAGGGGWVVADGDEVAAMAFAAYRVDQTVELGVETAPQWRGQGLATAAAAAMIDNLLLTRVTPVWSCREDNVGSFRLATTLGFRPTLRLPYYRLPAVERSTRRFGLRRNPAPFGGGRPRS